MSYDLGFSDDEVGCLCEFCLKSGHKSNDCPMILYLKTCKRCAKCDKYGHEASNCPTKISWSSLYYAHHPRETTHLLKERGYVDSCPPYGQIGLHDTRTCAKTSHASCASPKPSHISTYSNSDDSYSCGHNNENSYQESRVGVCHFEEESYVNDHTNPKPTQKQIWDVLQAMISELKTRFVKGGRSL